MKPDQRVRPRAPDLLLFTALVALTLAACGGKASTSVDPTSSPPPPCDDPCAHVACPPIDSCHDEGKCDPTTGECVNPPKPDGASCNDDNPCTPADTCVTGACVGTMAPAAILDGGHDAPSEGDPDGTGFAELKLDGKNGQICYELSWKDIDLPNEATLREGEDGPDVVKLFVGAPSHSGCVSVPPALVGKIGAAPADYHVSVGTDEYPHHALHGRLDRFMVCKGDACNEGGVCDPATGACAETKVLDGTTCDDGDPTTLGDACGDGVCGAAALSPASIYNVEDSYLLPNKGDIHVALVFAYCNASSAPAAILANQCYNVPASGMAPPGASSWFDPGSAPVIHGYVTDYFAQVSFDAYKVYGDYWAAMVGVPCASGTQSGGWNDTQAVINYINSASTPWLTSHVLPKSLFDAWTPTSPGVPKINAPNAKLDAVVVMWANHAGFPCNTGFGLQSGWSGVDAAAGFGASDYGFEMFLTEYFHALYGGNNWHQGGGAGAHSFLTHPALHGFCGQANATAKIANAWDRQQMGWKPPAKTQLLMAADPTCTTNVASDLDVSTHPNGGVYCLRDFSLTGDALRIKLPHLDWNTATPGQSAAIKNQYLLVENHRLQLSQLPPKYSHNIDLIGSGPSPLPPGVPGYQACQEPSQPGIYAYLQSGKDVKTHTVQSELYNPGYDKPNALGSWMYPLPAEGSWDYVYRTDLLQAGNPALACNWGNQNVPKQPWSASTLPNPFTGLSDLTALHDTNNDGHVYTGDRTVGLSEVWRSGAVMHTWPEHGDGNDSFRPGYRTRIGLDTDPAPTPQYTFTINPSYQNGAAPYENRRVWLNGVSVEIIGQQPTGELLVQVLWDDTTVQRDVRWTGDIVLKSDPDDPLARPGEIDLASCATIDLDRGVSPTHPDGTPSGGSYLFTDPTALTLESGTVTTVDDDAKIVVRNGSTLYVKASADLAVLGNGSIVVDDGAYVCFEPGANLGLFGSGSRVLLHPGALIGLNPALGMPNPTCQALGSITYSGAGQIVTSACVTPPGPSGTTLAYWPFDAPSPTAELVHGNTPALHNGVGACDGITGGALCFDGITGYAEVADNAFLDVGTGSFTIDGWLRSNDTTGVRVLLDKRVEGVGSVRGYSLYLSDGKLSLQLADRSGSTNCSNSASAACTNYSSGTFVADGLWHHVAVTVERANANGGTFYVDGCPSLPQFNPTFRPGSLDNASPLVFGRRSSNNNGFAAVALDDFQIYKRALSPAEIRQLARSVGVGVCNGPF